MPAQPNSSGHRAAANPLPLNVRFLKKLAQKTCRTPRGPYPIILSGRQVHGVRDSDLNLCWLAGFQTAPGHTQLKLSDTMTVAIYLSWYCWFSA